MMKSYTLCLVVMALTLWAARAVRSADAPSPVYDIPRLDHITIDGKADAWGERGFRIDQLAPVDGRFLPVAEHDSHCRLGWTTEGLVVLIWVRQERWQESADDSQLWTHDCIELYLAPEKGHESICQWVVTPGMDAAHDRPRWHLNDFRRTQSLKGLPAELQVARTKTDHGCLVEILLPWSALAIQPVVGREVGFQLWTTHYQPGKPELYYAAWLPALGSFYAHQNVQRIRLAEAASPPVIARAYGDYDLRAARALITVTAPTAAAGQSVTISSGKKVLATGVLAANETGRAGASFALPPPPRGPAVSGRRGAQ